MDQSEILMAKQNWGTSFVKNLKQNGWIEINGQIKLKSKLSDDELKQIDIKIAKKSINRSQGLKTAWIDDYRNIRNKETQNDMFIQFIKQELGLTVWPEFYFSRERQYRIDYAIPVDGDGRLIKLGIEVDGGIWCKGNSGHSSGKGIKRDQEKASLLASLGWILIRVQPSELVSNYTYNLIKKSLENVK